MILVAFMFHGGLKGQEISESTHGADLTEGFRQEHIRGCFDFDVGVILLEIGITSLDQF